MAALAALCLCLGAAAGSGQVPEEKDMGAYLMVYHKDADHGLHMAISYDGYEFKALNGDKPVIAVDTHVYRVSRRLGLSDGKTVTEVEKDLTDNIPPELRPVAHHWLILHGRYVCTARKPGCDKCELARWCRTRNTDNTQ